MGRNGSGKSTLLKCLAGIYGIDEGEIAVAGRLSPFIELGVGFNPDLTARDNVVINAIMLGLTRKQARERFDDVIAFAELEEFIDLKLKNYSSGMSVRLGFSTAIQVDADVLLVDEVLAVGDASFQAKCFAEFDRMKREGRTILFVTHDMSSVERFCDRAMLLERGEVVQIGPPDEVARLYSELNFGHTAGAEPAGDGAPRGVRITGAWCEDESGERVVSAPQGGSCRACFEAEFERDIEDPLFAITFRNDVRHTIFVATSAKHGLQGSFARRRAGDGALRVPQLARPQPLHAHPLDLRGPAGAGGRAGRRPDRADRGGQDGHRQRGRRAHRAGGGARVSAHGMSPARYRGPAAIGDDLRRFWSLTYTLAATDFKLRFFGSALGYLWSLARPLLLFGTLYFVFTKIVKFGEGVQYYPVYLLSGIVLFTFFSETTSRGVRSLIERENLLRKMRFPRMVIPLSVTLHSLFNLGLNLIVVFVFIFGAGITPTLDWVQIPLLIVMLVAFTTGVTMLAVGAVRALPRRGADLGGGACSCCSTARRSST